MWRRSFLVFLSLGLPALAQKYSGPRPPKTDLPYLLHADSLVPTEAAEAKEQQEKEGITYVIAGANSSAQTPLAEPIFLLQAEKLDPEKLQLYKLESKEGHREISFSNKKRAKNPQPFLLTVRRLASDNLFRLEADQSLEAGEYSLTPEGSNQVFCFRVF